MSFASEEVDSEFEARGRRVDDAAIRVGPRVRAGDNRAVKANVRVALVLLLAALAALAAVWHLVGERDESAGIDSVRRDDAIPGAPSPPPLPHGARPAEDGAPATLRGRTAPADVAPVSTGVRVNVRSMGGIPVPGARVRASWSREGTALRAPTAVTASDGSAYLPEVPVDGSAEVAVWLPDGRRERRAALASPTSGELHVTLDEGLLVRVRCVDDLTGRELSDAVVRGEVPRPKCEGGMPEGDDWILALVKKDRVATVRFRVEAPPGYVAWDFTRFATAVGAWTHELEGVYPLRREAEVWVTVLDHEGQPEDRAAIHTVAIGGRTATGRSAERRGPGVFRLRGAPFFRAEVLTVAVSSPEHESGVRGSVRLGVHPADRTDLVITLPPPGAEQNTHDSLIGMGGGAGGALGRRRRDLRTGEALIVVQRHDGSPASNARVSVGGRIVRTDDRGEVRVSKLWVGEHEVVVHAIGLLPLEDVVYVRANERVRLVLREPDGGAIDVRVTDADGYPLPFATIHVRMPSKGHWIDEHDGRQRADPYTDHQGRRRLERVEAGVVTVRADWAGRTAKTAVEVREGRLARVTLVPE